MKCDSCPRFHPASCTGPLKWLPKWEVPKDDGWCVLKFEGKIYCALLLSPDKKTFENFKESERCVQILNTCYRLSQVFAEDEDARFAPLYLSGLKED